MRLPHALSTVPSENDQQDDDPDDADDVRRSSEQTGDVTCVSPNESDTGADDEQRHHRG
jgi:hypothetical protein